MYLTGGSESKIILATLISHNFALVKASCSAYWQPFDWMTYYVLRIYQYYLSGACSQGGPSLIFTKATEMSLKEKEDVVHIVDRGDVLCGSYYTQTDHRICYYQQATLWDSFGSGLNILERFSCFVCFKKYEEEHEGREQLLFRRCMSLKRLRVSTTRPLLEVDMRSGQQLWLNIINDLFIYALRNVNLNRY